jgi:hypothetical protein
MAHYRQIRVMTAAEGTVGTTDAILEAHSFTISPQDFPNNGLPKVSAADIVGTAIEIKLWEKVSGIWNPVFEDGAELLLTATKPQTSINSYGTYAVSKAAATTGVTTIVTRIR